MVKRASFCKDKIKVVRIIARLNIGGPAIHTILLSEGLNKEGFETVLVTGACAISEGDMFSFAASKSVRPLVIPQLKREINPFNDIIALARVFFILLKEKPDIIHTHTAKAGVIGRVAGIAYNIFSFRKKCLLIHTFHGTVLQGYFNKHLSSIFVLIERVSSLFTDRIVTVSESIKKELLSYKIGNADKIIVIPLGLELDKLLSVVRNGNLAQLNIGIVGRLVPVKNHRLFLESVKLFNSESRSFSIPCKFFVIGDGELRNELERIALDYGISHLVEFRGWELDTEKIYEDLDIVVLTSLNEGTPLSLIEAMAAARPVIATDVGGVRDLFVKCNIRESPSKEITIYDNGILFLSNDPAGLVEALRILALDKGIRERMGQEGRKFTAGRFSKERLIKDVSLLYNNTLKSLPAGRPACRTGRQGECI